MIRVRRWEQSEVDGKYGECAYLTLDDSVDELNVSARAYNIFKANDLKTLRDLAAMTDMDWLRVPNMGKVTLAEIRALIDYDPLAKSDCGEMVKRVSDAIMAASGPEAKARAAIAAMREPTKAMVAAIWDAMIDEALK